MSRVVVLGSVNIDLVVTVDRLPGAGQTVVGGAFARHHGGKGANQAVAVARLGAEVSFVGAVGEDEFGGAARDALVAEGVDAGGLRVLPGEHTGVALIVVDMDGENQIAVGSGANGAFGAEIWAGASDRPADVFLTNFEVGDDAIVAGAMTFAAQGAVVVLNPAPPREIPAALLELHPIVVANGLEAQALTGVSDPAAAARALAARCGAPVVVTLGSRGALVVEKSNVANMAAPHVLAVDTTGAGDTFCGALAVRLAEGAPLADAVEFSVCAASLSVTLAGARVGMPTREQVEAALAQAT